MLTPKFYRLFVYGSLKDGFPLHGILGRSEFLGRYRTRPEFVLYDLTSFPAMASIIPGGKGYEIEGEVYLVSEDILNYVDVVESVKRGLYIRKPISVHDQKNEEMTVFAYLWPRASTANIVESGVW